MISSRAVHLRNRAPMHDTPSVLRAFSLSPLTFNLNSSSAATNVSVASKRAIFEILK